MEEDYDFRSDSKFSRYELDVAAEEQADLYGKWARLYSEAEDDVRDLDKKIKLLESQYYVKMMKEYKNMGYEKKPTDKGIEAWYTTQADYQELQNQWLDVMRRLGIFKEAKRSMEHRKKAIEIEASLYIAGFWAKPEFSGKAESNLKDIRKENRDRKTSERIQEKMRRRVNGEN